MYDLYTPETIITDNRSAADNFYELIKSGANDIGLVLPPRDAKQGERESYISDLKELGATARHLCSPFPVRAAIALGTMRVIKYSDLALKTLIPQFSYSDTPYLTEMARLVAIEYVHKFAKLSQHWDSTANNLNRVLPLAGVTINKGPQNNPEFLASAVSLKMLVYPSARVDKYTITPISAEGRRLVLASLGTYSAEVRIHGRGVAGWGADVVAERQAQIKERMESRSNKGNIDTEKLNITESEMNELAFVHFTTMAVLGEMSADIHFSQSERGQRQQELMEKQRGR